MSGHPVDTTEVVDDPPAAPDVRKPVLADAVSECRCWADIIDGYAEQARSRAARAEAAGQIEDAVASIQAGEDWQFRADSLRLALSVIETIIPFEAKVRTFLRGLRGKGKPKAEAA